MRRSRGRQCEKQGTGRKLGLSPLSHTSIRLHVPLERTSNSANRYPVFLPNSTDFLLEWESIYGKKSVCQYVPVFLHQQGTQLILKSQKEHRLPLRMNAPWKLRVWSHMFLVDQESSSVCLAVGRWRKQACGDAVRFLCSLWGACRAEESTGPHVGESGNVSRSVLSESLQPHGLQPARLLCPGDSPGKNTGVGCHFLLQGIFPTQRLNSRLPLDL